MTIKEFAKSISGKEYGYPQFTKEEIETAKENGWVIMLWDRALCLTKIEGCTLCKGGKLVNTKQKVSNIKPVYNKDMIGGNTVRDKVLHPWTYETDIPHETFMVYMDGEPYCRGIVFSIDDAR